MTFKYLPHTDEDIRAMLDVVGAPSLDALYDEVPDTLKLTKPVSLPDAMSEEEIRRHFEELGRKNQPLVCFAGDGAYDHYSPSVVAALTSRSEFLTSYTPYQAEISQGTLQYIFEFQTMMAGLTGMDLSNASMYDGSTATAEAMMMCVAAAKKRNRVLLASTLPPRIRKVVLTYAGYHGVNVDLIPQRDGATDREALAVMLATDDVAGVIVGQPNYYGVIEDFTGLADLCHAHKALFVVNGRASALGVLKSPGEWGADIACGDAQSLGLPLNYGGPYIGYLCTTKALVRKMPGRLVGGTTDADGRRAFVLTMQAREQHIRREKATSNICTSQGIMCLYVAIYLSLMGEKGLREVNEHSYAAAHYLHDALLATGRFEPVFDQPFLEEFCLRYKGDAAALHRYCADHGFLAGVLADGVDGGMLFTATERRTKEETDRLVGLIEKFKEGGLK